MEDSTTNPIDVTIDNPESVQGLSLDKSQGESLRQTPTTNNDSAVVIDPTKVVVEPVIQQPAEAQPLPGSVPENVIPEDSQGESLRQTDTTLTVENIEPVSVLEIESVIPEPITTTPPEPINTPTATPTPDPIVIPIPIPVFIPSSNPQTLPSTIPTPTPILSTQTNSILDKFRINMGRTKELLIRAIFSRKRKQRNNIEKVMKLFVKKDKINNRLVRDFLHVSDDTATDYLNILIKEGRIKLHGKGTATYYTKI